LGLCHAREGHLDKACAAWKGYYNPDRPEVMREINVVVAMLETGQTPDPAEAVQALEAALDQGLAKARNGKAQVFFRADDVAVPGNLFTSMAHVFREAGAPLNMAVVPAWLTASRWAALRKAADGGELFAWCQHGWRHVNHEPQGQKKREFGQARPNRDKRQDLSKGFRRLGEIMEKDFTPVFVPPWNRCDGESMAAMAAARSAKPLVAGA